MNWLTKHAVISLVIINLFSIHLATSQTTYEIVVFSDQQFHNGNFELAANEYNRALFFGYRSPDELCLKIANCYINLNKPTLSAIFFDRAYFSGTTDSIKTEAILGKAFSLILDKQFMLAISELINLDSARIEDQNLRLNFLKGIAYFGLNQDQLAETSLKKCLKKSSNQSNIEAIEKEFTKIQESEKRFNPHTAWLMSLILPGSGQIYAGNYKESANSVLLLGGLVYLATTLAARYSTLEAIVIIFPWFQRYYLGWAGKAEKLTLEKQISKRNKSYQAILRQIELVDQKKAIN